MHNAAALYLRSSRDRADVSIDAQRRALHELAAQRGLVVVDEYADAVESGKDDDRPAFQRLIHALKQPVREWDHILVLDTSRVARRRLISMIFEKDCEKRQVRLIYKSLPESDPATDMVLRSVLQAFDEYHSLSSRAKGLAGMAENVRQGWRAGGKAPRGYQLDYHATGAIRDGMPVLKSKLIIDETTAPAVRGYLRLRATGISRGVAIARLQLPWPASSTHSMDWQALTYAGHTVWNMHSSREGGKSVSGEKRRPRAEWLLNENTHEPLISQAEAEAILKQQERAQMGKRVRESPLLLSGLLVEPGGASWHSDGCGYYRLGKGKKISAKGLEAKVLAQLVEDFSSDEGVARLQEEIARIAGVEPIDGRRLAGIERRIVTLTQQIGKTVDLAAQVEDPLPILRRVKDLEHQRAGLVAELKSMRDRSLQQSSAAMLDEGQIRALLRQTMAEILELSAGEDKSAARQEISEVVERIELDALATSFQTHYAMQAGVKLASPRGTEQTPVRWCSAVIALGSRRCR